MIVFEVFNGFVHYLLYTQGCYCGRFTDRNCILSAHVTSPAGACAVVGNSSYGPGPEDPDRCLLPARTNFKIVEACLENYTRIINSSGGYIFPDDIAEFVRLFPGK
jgi:hypothetical protein